VSLVIWATISDFVGAPPFFAITRLLVEKIRGGKNALPQPIRRATYHSISRSQTNFSSTRMRKCLVF
jgi:hypothetical protein